jgi:hypothetical protein
MSDRDDALPIDAWELVRDAEGRGVDRPVLLIFCGAAGERIAAELGHPGGLVDGPDGPMAPGQVVALSRAAALLRRHCGGGGEAAARQLEDGALGAPRWLVMVLAEEVAGGAFDAQGRRLCRFRFAFDADPRRCRTIGGHLADDGPACMPMELRDGRRLNFYGRDGVTASLAAALAASLLSGELRLPAPGGQEVALKATDDLLSEYLRRCFDHAPAAVAECLHALRGLDGGRHVRRLKGLLWGRPELRDLAKKVHAELTGEAGPTERRTNR